MRLILKQVARSLVTIFIVINLSFVLLQLLPGGPIDYLEAQLVQQGDISPRELEGLTEAYINVYPDQPLQDQYVDYMSSLMQGDLGTSIFYSEPVATILGEAVPWTVFLLLSGILITFTLGITLGAFMALVEGTRKDITLTGYSIVSTSIPYYVVAVVLVFYLGHLSGWFPTTGRYPNTTSPGLTPSFVLGVAHHAALPVFSLVFSGMGGWALSMRGNSIRVLGEDYLRVGRLRGLSSWTLTTRYVARNAILPLYTRIMISLGYIFGGSIVLETIFVYRGLGYYIYKGVETRDYPLMMGGFIIITCAVITGLLIAELTYGRIDPRIAEGGASQ